MAIFNSYVKLPEGNRKMVGFPRIYVRIADPSLDIVHQMEMGWNHLK